MITVHLSSRLVWQKVTEFYQFKIQYTAKGAQMDFERWEFVKLESRDTGMLSKPPMGVGNKQKENTISMNHL